MPNTYSQIYIQVVFSVKGRHSLISPSWETELYKYIAGIITNKGQKLIAINGMPDHIHILIGQGSELRDHQCRSARYGWPNRPARP